MSAEPIVHAWSPACFEPDELALWQQADAAVQRTAGHSVLPCAECPPAFSAEMHEAKTPEYPQGRCNGTPRGGQEDTEMGTFDYAAPGVRTVVPTLEAAVGPVPRRAHTGRVTLDVTAPPCGSCVHEPVCALRAAFEGMATVETNAPPLPDGLRLALVATVECSHFLRDRAKAAPVRALTSQERGQANGAGAFRRAGREISDATRQKMRDSAIAARARKLEGAAAE